MTGRREGYLSWEWTRIIGWPAETIQTVLAGRSRSNVCSPEYRPTGMSDRDLAIRAFYNWHVSIDREIQWRPPKYLRIAPPQSIAGTMSSVCHRGIPCDRIGSRAKIGPPTGIMDCQKAGRRTLCKSSRKGYPAVSAAGPGLRLRGLPSRRTPLPPAQVTTYEGREDASGRPVASEIDTTLPAVAASRIEQGQPVIRYNPQALPQLKPDTRLFFFAHECARHTLGQATTGAARSPRSAQQASRRTAAPLSAWCAPG